MTMTPFATLQSKHGHRTILGHDFHAFFKELAERGEADVAIVSAEEGFSPLGRSCDFFEHDLNISYEGEIKPLANWNRSENERVTLVALASRRKGSLLRGVILAPGTNTRGYKPFARSYDPRPNRTFYYNVSYEAIAYACREWGARKFAISHLSGSGQYHEDIATCHAEALAHFCDAESEIAPDSFVFCGCCINEDHLKGIRRLNAEGNLTRHRPISVTVENEGESQSGCPLVPWGILRVAGTGVCLNFSDVKQHGNRGRGNACGYPGCTGSPSETQRPDNGPT